MQLPGTLPFEGIKPHSGNALEELLSMAGNSTTASAAGDEESSENNAEVVDPPTIGKLRVMKSGKVVLRI